MSEHTALNDDERGVMDKFRSDSHTLLNSQDPDELASALYQPMSRINDMQERGLLVAWLDDKPSNRDAYETLMDKYSFVQEAYKKREVEQRISEQAVSVDSSISVPQQPKGAEAVVKTPKEEGPRTLGEINTSAIGKRKEEQYYGDERMLEAFKTLEENNRLGLFDKKEDDGEKLSFDERQNMTKLQHMLAEKDYEEEQAGLPASDEEFVEQGFDSYGVWSHNFSRKVFDSLDIASWSAEEQVALIDIMGVYNDVDTEGKHIARGFEGVFSDLTTYMGFGAFANLMTKLPLQKAATSALNNWVNKKALPAALIAGTEGALYTAGDDIATQAIENKGDFSKNDMTRTAKSAAIGFAITAPTVGILTRLTSGSKKPNVTEAEWEKHQRAKGKEPAVKGAAPEPTNVTTIQSSDVTSIDVTNLPAPRTLDEVIEAIPEDQLPMVVKGTDEGDKLVTVGGRDLLNPEDVAPRNVAEVDEVERLAQGADNAAGEDWSHMYDGPTTKNTAHIDSPEDVLDFMESSSSHWEKHRGAQMFPTARTLSQLRENADELHAEYAEEFGDDIAALVKQHRNNAEKLMEMENIRLTLADVNNKLARQLVDLKNKVMTGEATPQEQYQMMQYFAMFAETLEVDKIFSKGAGRLLQSFNAIVKGDSGDISTIARMGGSFDAESVAMTINQMQAAGAFKRGQQSTKKKFWEAGYGKKGPVDEADAGMFKIDYKKAKAKMPSQKDWVDHLVTFRSAQMLSAPSTWGIAGVTNFVNLLKEPLVEFIGMLGKGEAKRLGRIRALAQYRGTQMFFKDSWKQAARAWKEGRHITDPFVTKIEDQLDSPLKEMSWMRRNLIERGLHQAHLILLFLDEGIKANRSRALAFSDAAVDAEVQGVARDSAAFQKILKERMDDAFTPEGRLVDKDYLQDVRDVTYTAELEGNRGKIFKLLGQSRIARLTVIPFVRAPINIVSEGLMYMPLPHHWSAKQRAILASGNPVAIAKLKARKQMGVAFMAAAGYAAKEGYLTGSGPRDPEMRRAWEAQDGRKAHSIRIGDEWYSYKKWEPFATVMGITADMVSLSDINYDRDFDLVADDIADVMLLSITENILAKAYFSGLDGIIKVLDGRRDFSSLYHDHVTSYIPNIASQANTDPYVHEARSLMEKVQRRVIGLSDELGIQYDIYGRPVLKPSMDIYPFGSLAPHVPLTDDIVGRTMWEMAEDLGRAVSAKPSTNLGQGSKVDFREVFDAGETESVYAKYNRYIGEVTDPSTGRNLFETLEALFSSPEWAHYPNSNGAGIESRATKRVKSDIDRYRSWAMQRIVQESDAYNEVRQEKLEIKRGVLNQ